MRNIASACFHGTRLLLITPHIIINRVTGERGKKRPHDIHHAALLSGGYFGG